MSRFLINLRQASEPLNDTAMQNLSRFSVPAGFRVPTTIDRVIGNMGESLEFCDYDNEDEQIDQAVDSTPEESADDVDHAANTSRNPTVNTGDAIEEVMLN